MAFKGFILHGWILQSEQHLMKKRKKKYGKHPQGEQSVCVASTACTRYTPTPTELPRFGWNLGNSAKISNYVWKWEGEQKKKKEMQKRPWCDNNDKLGKKEE